MSRLLRPIKIKNLDLPNNIFYSPLAGCSDYPFRKIARQFHKGLIFCEMVKMDALVRLDPKTFRMLDYSADMHPIGAQLCGSKPELAHHCAKMIEDMGFDVVDLNCGCPVDKVTKDGSGSGLLKNPEKIGDILHKMISSVSIPVTVKIRAGWDNSSINASEIVKIADQAGASIIFVHGRTRAQGYRGPANWDYIKECSQAKKDILVVGNGDVMSGDAAETMLTSTGCDGVLASRATMGAPWIAEEIENHLLGLPYDKKTPKDYKEILLRHMDEILSYDNAQKSVLSMRRVGCWYLREGKNTKKLREAINKSKDINAIGRIIRDFPWDTTDWELDETKLSEGNQRENTHSCHC